MTDRDLRNADLFGVQRLWRRFGDAVPYTAIEEGVEHADEGTPDVDSRLHQVMERRYGATEIRTRLFQAHFRREVLGAYRSRCAICRFGERPVLDGAHLMPDREELGAPRVPNGIALCALHHRSFDRDLIGITPELKLHVFRDRLEHAEDEETETAVIRFHERMLSVPPEETHRPDRDLVVHRWEHALER